MSRLFQHLLAEFYAYCDKNKMYDIERGDVEEFACWLDEYTDCIAEEPIDDTLPGR